MSDNEFNKENIELRSEKVRKLLGAIPPSLVGWSKVIITVISLAILATVCLIPYPYSNGESILRHIFGI